MLVLKSRDYIRYSCTVFLLLSYFHSFPQCPFTQSVQLSLETNGQAHAQALDFFTNPDDIASMALNREVYGCTNVGIQEIKLDIVNQNNEPYTCKDFIVISDPTGFCSDTPQFPKAILGKIVTPTGNPVQGVTIGISDQNASQVFRSTNEDGLYLFNNIPTDTYELEPRKDNDRKNGLSTRDIILLQKHLLHINTFDTPYKYIAADINNSGDLTAFDMILLKQMILNMLDKFPNNDSWRFVKVNHQFKNTSDPLKENVGTIRTIDYAPSLSLNNNYIGIKIGDLNNSVYANQTMEPRSKASFDLLMENPTLVPEEELTVDVMATESKEIEGFQIALSLNTRAIDLVEVLGLDKSSYNLKDGQLLISKAAANGILIEENGKLFSLKIRTKKTGKLSDYLQISNTSLANELYAQGAILALHLNYKSTPALVVGKNFPNPFVQTTYLPIDLPKSASVELKVLTLQGQILLQQNEPYKKGHHQIPIRASFPTAGIYFYQLTVDNQSFTGKLHFNNR